MHKSDEEIRAAGMDPRAYRRAVAERRPWHENPGLWDEGRSQRIELGQPHFTCRQWSPLHERVMRIATGELEAIVWTDVELVVEWRLLPNKNDAVRKLNALPDDDPRRATLRKLLRPDLANAAITGLEQIPVTPHGRDRLLIKVSSRDGRHSYGQTIPFEVAASKTAQRAFIVMRSMMDRIPDGLGRYPKPHEFWREFPTGSTLSPPVLKPVEKESETASDE